IAVSRLEDVILQTSPPYRTMAHALSLLAFALLLVHLFSRKRHAERRAREIASFTRELDKRERILHSVSYAAERFLRSDSWELSLPDAMERIGRAAEVTRVGVHRISHQGGEPQIHQLAEWIEQGVRQSLGSEAPSR